MERFLLDSQQVNCYFKLAKEVYDRDIKDNVNYHVDTVFSCNALTRDKFIPFRLLFENDRYVWFDSPEHRMWALLLMNEIAKDSEFVQVLR